MFYKLILLIVNVVFYISIKNIFILIYFAKIFILRVFSCFGHKYLQSEISNDEQI